MGFLDKLLGRGKDAAQSTGDTAQDLGSKATDTAADVGEKAKDAFDDAASKVTGDDKASEVGQAEERLDSARDDALRNEGRMP